MSDQNPESSTQSTTEELNSQPQKSNHFLKSPWFNLVSAILGGILVMFIDFLELKQKDVEIANNKYQAQINRKRDLYKIFLDKRSIIYTDTVQECESFLHITYAVFKDDIELSKIFDNLTIYTKNNKCKEIAKKLSDNAGISELDYLSKSELEQGEKAAESTQIKDLVNQLTTETRKQAALSLIKLSQDTNEKQKIVDTLVNEITTDNEYRKNLYIAYILGKIKPDQRLDNSQNQKVCGLKRSNNYGDVTFKKRVDQAIENLDLSKICK